MIRSTGATFAAQFRIRSALSRRPSPPRGGFGLVGGAQCGPFALISTRDWPMHAPTEPRNEDYRHGGTPTWTLEASFFTWYEVFNNQRAASSTSLSPLGFSSGSRHRSFFDRVAQRGNHARTPEPMINLTSQLSSAAFHMQHVRLTLRAWRIMCNGLRHRRCCKHPLGSFHSVQVV